MFLHRLLGRVATIFLGFIVDATGRLVSDSKRGHESRVPSFVLTVQVVEQTTALVDKCDKTPAGGEILGMNLEVFGKVGYAFRHAGNLIFRRTSVGFVSPPLNSEFVNALLRSIPCRRFTVIQSAILLIFSLQITDVHNVVLRSGRINVRYFFICIGFIGKGNSNSLVVGTLSSNLNGD
jgi:hypothetical protein